MKTLPSQQNIDASGVNTFSFNNKVAFLRRKKVEEITGLSRSSIYAQMADGTFPKNITIGAKGVRWVESEIAAWCLEKIKNRK